MAVLETRGIVKRFGGLTAVSEASLAAQAGRITALIGPNGAGKTTLFAVVAGFLKPDAGSVHFDGRDITGLAPHRICRLGLVRTFQIVQPFGALTVRENIAIGSHLHQRARRRALEEAERIARQVAMEAQLDMPAQGLTVAGRKRRCGRRAPGSRSPPGRRGHGTARRPSGRGRGLRRCRRWAYRRSYLDRAWFGLSQTQAEHLLAHADAVFASKFEALARMCSDSKELGYEMLWQGAAEAP